MPRLLGHVPALKQDPWAFAECYLQDEDRYHIASPDAWGVPGKTPVSESGKVASWGHPECRLACPCAASQPSCRWEKPAACAGEFDWKGVTYSGCTNVDHEKPWCQHHHQHLVLEAGQGDDWSNCVYNCDSEDQDHGISNCGWKAPASCAAQFDYDGILFRGCSTAENHSPWCSNTAFYEGSWEHCQYQCDNATAEDTKVTTELNQFSESEKELCHWEPSSKCSPTFMYKGAEHSGCMREASHLEPWCSHDAEYVGKWTVCERVCKTVSSHL